MMKKVFKATEQFIAGLFVHQIRLILLNIGNKKFNDQNDAIISTRKSQEMASVGFTFLVEMVKEKMCCWLFSPFATG